MNIYFPQTRFSPLLFYHTFYCMLIFKTYNWKILKISVPSCFWFCVALHNYPVDASCTIVEQGGIKSPQSKEIERDLYLWNIWKTDSYATYFQSCADSAITWYVLPSVTILKAFSFSPLSTIRLRFNDTNLKRQEQNLLLMLIKKRQNYFIF